MEDNWTLDAAPATDATIPRCQAFSLFIMHTGKAEPCKMEHVCRLDTASTALLCEGTREIACFLYEVSLAQARKLTRLPANQ